MIKHSHDDSVILNINSLNNCKLAIHTLYTKDKKENVKTTTHPTDIFHQHTKSKPPLFI
jgi:hypothetical protein